MTSATGNETPAAGPVPRRAPRRPTGTPASGGSGLFTLLWLVFLAFLVFEPERLDAVWSWFRDLPVVGQVVGWVLLAPLLLGLVVWQAPWALWARVTVIVLLALVTMITFSPRPQPHAR